MLFWVCFFPGCLIRLQAFLQFSDLRIQVTVSIRTASSSFFTELLTALPSWAETPVLPGCACRCSASLLLWEPCLQLLSWLSSLNYRLDLSFSYTILAGKFSLLIAVHETVFSMALLVTGTLGCLGGGSHVGSLGQQIRIQQAGPVPSSQAGSRAGQEAPGTALVPVTSHFLGNGTGPGHQSAAGEPVTVSGGFVDQWDHPLSCILHHGRTSPATSTPFLDP